jgi:uncharacterized protein YndB with AHSA1/START domain
MNKTARVFLGLAAANVFAFILLYVSTIAVDNLKHNTATTTGMSGYTASNTLIFSDFVIIPLLMGIISSWVWRNAELKGVMYLVYSIPNTIIALSFSWLFMGEGYICLLIVSPLVFSFIVAGAYLGRFMFRKKKHMVNGTIFAALLGIFTTDFATPHTYENMVSDTMVINAPPEKVWQYVAAYERNDSPDEYWLFKIGMPSPVQSTVSGYYEGAERKCIFSNGYTFDEKMTVFKPNEELTFEITTQPRDPEIMGHIDILKGQFILTNNGNGTTTLVGNSWYKLYVFPSWYYDLWASSVTRNVHIRVMQHIRYLSEKNV